MTGTEVCVKNKLKGNKIQISEWKRNNKKLRSSVMIIMEMNKKIFTAVYALFAGPSGRAV